jgi:hypothetical protein
MDTQTPLVYIAPEESANPWWVHMLAGGIAGRPKPVSPRPELLQAAIAGRRAAASARMKATRARSERAIARLIRETAA